MGLRSMQQNLQKQNEQESSLIAELTTALEQTKANNNQLQQQLQAAQQENSSLKAELTTAYKQIQSLTTSDLQLQEAQQLKRDAEKQLETSRSLMKSAKSLQRQNEQQSKNLQSREQMLLRQQNQLREKESSLQKSIEDAKAEAQDEAKAVLADDWQKLEEAKDAAEKEREEARQQAENLKAEAQRELAEAQNAKAAAAEKGYQDTASKYTLAIRCMIIYCVVLGLLEVIKHWYIINLYYDWYIGIKVAHGIYAAAAVAVAAVGIFVVTYFVAWSDCDRQEYYLGLSIRLMLLVWLFVMADAVADTTAAITIYLSCVVVGIVRYMVNSK